MGKFDREQILRTSGVDVLKCMRCGKCSATCPSYDEMEYHPHEFVYMVEKGETEKLMNSPNQQFAESGFASPLLAAHQHGGHSVGAPGHASAPLGSYAQHPAVETVHPEIFRRYALCQRSHSVLAVPFGKGVHIGK